MLLLLLLLHDKRCLCCLCVATFYMQSARVCVCSECAWVQQSGPALQLLSHPILSPRTSPMSAIFGLVQFATPVTEEQKLSVVHIRTLTS